LPYNNISYEFFIDTDTYSTKCTSQAERKPSPIHDYNPILPHLISFITPSYQSLLLSHYGISQVRVPYGTYWLNNNDKNKAEKNKFKSKLSQHITLHCATIGSIPDIFQIEMRELLLYLSEEIVQMVLVGWREYRVPRSPPDH
jgi:hypothetical protein